MHCVGFEAKILHKPYTEPYMGTKSQRDKETKRQRDKETKRQRDKERKSERVKERKAKKNLRKAKKNLRKANFKRELTPTPP